MPRKPKDTTEVPSGTPEHIAIQYAQYAVKNMSSINHSYWSGHARKRKQTLTQAVTEYLLKDFGIPTTEVAAYLKVKQETPAAA